MRAMQHKRTLMVGAAFVGVLGALGVAQSTFQKAAAAQAKGGAQAPRFEVDPMWPKPLPNHWVMGMTIGVSVDAQDHIWILNRPRTNDPRELHAQSDPPAAECCGT